jgi:hypothetical protein
MPRATRPPSSPQWLLHRRLKVKLHTIYKVEGPNAFHFVLREYDEEFGMMNCLVLKEGDKKVSESIFNQVIFNSAHLPYTVEEVNKKQLAILGLKGLTP